jgi:hypothetical protein
MNRVARPASPSRRECWSWGYRYDPRQSPRSQLRGGVQGDDGAPNTVAGNEALALAGSRMFPSPAYFGLGPGMIKTGIRENLMGRNGSLGYRLLKGSFRVFFQSPQTYAARIVLCYSLQTSAAIPACCSTEKADSGHIVRDSIPTTPIATWPRLPNCSTAR